MFLKKQFNQNKIIVISTLIFGLGHVASAFQGQGSLLTILTIINALIFGFLAIILLYHCRSLIPLFIIHFLFDFESKIFILEGAGLAVAEGIKGAIMLIYVIVLFIILKKNKEQKI